MMQDEGQGFILVKSNERCGNLDQIQDSHPAWERFTRDKKLKTNFIQTRSLLDVRGEGAPHNLKPD